MSEPVRIRVALPLPLDVVGTITNLLSLVYPNGVIETETFRRELVMRVDLRDRRRLPSKGRATDARLYASNDHDEGDVDALGNGVFQVALPEEIGKRLIPAFRETLQDPAAKNYVSMAFREVVEPYDTYTVEVCRSAGQTPHALRMKAEAVLDRVRALVESLVKENDAETYEALCAALDGDPA